MLTLLDCTLRDGGYYNSWDFDVPLVNDYLHAMQAAGVNIVELGLRSLANKGFKGACAYTTDDFLDQLTIPAQLKVAVMVNAVELLGELPLEAVLTRLFPLAAEKSRVDVVRIACHVHEFAKALPACNWLKERGYTVGFNLMQVADRSQEEVEALSFEASKYPLDALYFADSMGSMDPQQTATIIGWLRRHWQGALGIHTHDNMGLALQNTLCAVNNGVTWLDATVTGMGRGPGNARTEELVIEAADINKRKLNIVPLMTIIRSYFQPLKNKCGWGSNPYYYLAGKYGIHPTYIQEMLGDSRYSEEDILAAIEHLKHEGGKKFSTNTLGATRHFYKGAPQSKWNPEHLFKGREVLILGAGPGVAKHRHALEQYISSAKPLVVALNTQSSISQSLIDVRIACHPVRMLADCDAYKKLLQPLIIPQSLLPEEIIAALKGKDILDFGINVEQDTFVFNHAYCTVPNSLVISYALATATCGGASKLLLAGFDGYGADDPRTKELQHILSLYQAQSELDIISVTPTSYNIPSLSIYALGR